MKKHIIYFISLFAFVACNDMDTTIDNLEVNIEQGLSDVILQPRNPDLTNQLSNPKPETRSADNSLPYPYKYLGYSYKLGNCIVGHPKNIVRAIVDIESLHNDESMKGYITTSYIRDGTSEVKSYANYDRFEKNTEITKKVETGFSVNVGLFKLGRKNTINNTFKNNEVNLNQELTGEVNLKYIHSKVWLDNISAAQKRIASNHLTGTFVDGLYNGPIYEILDKWGPYVVSHYCTGGRATALYVAEYKLNTTDITKERDLIKHLNASFAWKTKDPNQSVDSVGANFGYTYKGGNTISTESRITNVHNQITISGGDPKFNITTQSGPIDNNTLDLSEWFSSLSDESTHVVVDIEDEGLVGLDKFVLEENFKRRIRDTHMEYLDKEDFQEPFIEIAKVYVRSTSSNEKLYDVAAVLNTRQGDKIVLSDGSAKNATDAELRNNNNNTVFMNKANEIARQKAKYYQCEIKANPQRIITPYLRYPLSIELNKFDESRVYKYKNPKTNIWYIYDTVSRIAYSYYDEEYIPWLYGMLDWFESVPVKSIPMSSLYQLFTIIGL